MSELRDRIADFLAHRRLAFVGLSSDEKAFSRYVDKALVERDYDVVPINPHCDAIGERPCHASLADVDEPVYWALIMVPPDASVSAVQDCIVAGVNRIWLHRGAGPGSDTDEAIALCREHNVEVVPGQCPMMFLNDVEFFHAIHAAIKKLGGSYPTDRPDEVDRKVFQEPLSWPRGRI